MPGKFYPEIVDNATISLNIVAQATVVVATEPRRRVAEKSSPTSEGESL
jgi:hypothetical protein